MPSPLWNLAGRVERVAHSSSSSRCNAVSVFVDGAYLALEPHLLSVCVIVVRKVYFTYTLRTTHATYVYWLMPATITGSGLR